MDDLVTLRPGASFTTLADLARAMRCSERSARSSLAELVRRGYLVADEVPGVGTAYLLAFPGEDAEAVRADHEREAVVIVKPRLARLARALR